MATITGTAPVISEITITPPDPGTEEPFILSVLVTEQTVTGTTAPPQSGEVYSGES